MEEVKKVEEACAELRQAEDGRPGAMSVIFHEGRIDGGEQAKDGWMLLFGEALMHLNEAGRTKI